MGVDKETKKKVILTQLQALAASAMTYEAVLLGNEQKIYDTKKSNLDDSVVEKAIDDMKDILISNPHPLGEKLVYDMLRSTNGNLTDTFRRYSETVLDCITKHQKCIWPHMARELIVTNKEAWDEWYRMPRNLRMEKLGYNPLESLPDDFFGPLEDFVE